MKILFEWLSSRGIEESHGVILGSPEGFSLCGIRPFWGWWKKREDRPKCKVCLAVAQVRFSERDVILLMENIPLETKAPE
jgi:hypothetical protein